MYLYHFSHTYWTVTFTTLFTLVIQLPLLPLHSCLLHSYCYHFTQMYLYHSIYIYCSVTFTTSFRHIFTYFVHVYHTIPFPLWSRQWHSYLQHFVQTYLFPFVQVCQTFTFTGWLTSVVQWITFTSLPRTVLLLCLHLSQSTFTMLLTSVHMQLLLPLYSCLSQSILYIFGHISHAVAITVLPTSFSLVLSLYMLACSRLSQITFATLLTPVR